MPETRYIQEFKDGVLVQQIPYEVSDEEIYQEQLRVEFNEVHDQAIIALDNWDSLTIAQKDLILKKLLKWALWKDERLHLDAV